MIVVAYLVLAAFGCATGEDVDSDKGDKPRIASAETPTPKYVNSGFQLISPEVSEGGALPNAYTCDGAGATLPLQWSRAPEGTKSYAVIMHHIPGEGDSHWYWVVYDIPNTYLSLGKNATGPYALGNNSVNGRIEYAPPCSKGGGLKEYTYTVFALSAEPKITVSKTAVSRNVLLQAMSEITLAMSTLNVTYTR